jgi:hypothetical protein
MDQTRHLDDELRANELVEKYRDQIVERAKATMLARQGERITAVIFDRGLLEAQVLLAASPPSEHPTTSEVVGIVQRNWALAVLSQLNPAASDWLPCDHRSGDLYRLPVIVPHHDGLQCFAVNFTT